MPQPPETHARCVDYFRGLQDRIVAGLEEVDGRGRFREDAWERPGGGGGRTRVLLDGGVFEKGGVNFSAVDGRMPEEFAAHLRAHLDDSRKRFGATGPAPSGHDFTATGVSLVLHPRNPFVPTVHANFRFLTLGGIAWFGGGADLTPYYPFREDVVHFHRVWKRVCENHVAAVRYPLLKAWCDEYFFLAHRNEPRGVGGIFFDHLEGDFGTRFDFVREAGDAFLDAYLPIVWRRTNTEYTERHRGWQEFRRGRYVEFNLIYDRGTTFGLKTGGRTESILMSLPPVVRWGYDVRPEPGSPEAELYEVYLKPRDWAAEP
jgi:coproporphyrinogen III oxidase